MNDCIRKIPIPAAKFRPCNPQRCRRVASSFPKFIIPLDSAASTVRLTVAGVRTDRSGFDLRDILPTALYSTATRTRCSTATRPPVRRARTESILAQPLIDGVEGLD